MDVLFTILYHGSGSGVYKSVAHKLEEWLKIHYPGAKVEVHDTKGENKIEIKMTRGVLRTDEFIAYVESASEDKLEQTVDEKLPKIVMTINDKLAGMGYKIDPKS